MYANGWRLVSTGRFGEPGDRWELFDVSKECNEVTDLAQARPDMVATLERKWLAAAKRYDVLPIDPRSQRQKSMVEFFEGGGRSRWELRPPLDIVPVFGGPSFFGRSHRIEIEIDPLKRGDEGVLVAFGNLFLGFVIHVRDGKLTYEAACRPISHRISGAIAPGARTIAFEQTMTARPWKGAGVLSVDGRTVAEITFERALLGRPTQGLEIGANGDAPVGRDYAQPFRFTGAIRRVKIDVDPSPYTAAEIASFDAAFGGR
jgi:arylsulfatase